MLTSAYIDLMIFIQTSPKDRRETSKNRRCMVNKERQLGYLRAVNGIPGSVRPLGTSEHELKRQILEKNGKIIPVALDGTILKKNLKIEVRFGGQRYRRGVVQQVHFDDGTVTIHYGTGVPEQRVEGYLVRGLPFFRRDHNQQKFVSKEEVVIEKWGAVFMQMLERARERLSRAKSFTNNLIDTAKSEKNTFSSVTFSPVSPKVKISTQHRLMAACILGNVSTAQEVVRGHSSLVLRGRDAMGRTPMMVSCGEGNLHFARWLFKAGAAEDVSSLSQGGLSPLSYACRGGHVEVCSWLLEVAPRGILHKPDGEGLTPMHWAAKTGHLEVCECLYHAGGAYDIYAQCDSGYSPMHYALQMHHMKVAEWLVLKGAMDPSFDSSIAHAVFLEVAVDGAAYEELLAFAHKQVTRLTRLDDWVGDAEHSMKLYHLNHFISYLEF